MEETIFESSHLKRNQDRWLVTIPLSGSVSSIKYTGSGRIFYNGAITQFSVPFSGAEHTIVKIEGGLSNIRICSFPGGIQRCYARIKDNNLLVSNMATSLFDRNEKIGVNSEVLLRQICNFATPIDDLFIDAILLDPSSIFRISGKKIVFEESTIKPVKSSISSVHELILDEFDKICKSGKPLAVLLSAGIDSRLNLALCYHFSKIYKNEVIAYHEYKDKKEHDIAKNISDIIKVPFISVSRDRFKKEPLKVLLDPEFIEFHGGLYRESILRWIPYSDWIRSVNPDCVIIGMGAEAHKGKFYRDIKNLSSDSRRILGSKFKINLREEIEFAHFASNKKMNDFFTTLSKRALIFDSLSSQVDFVHYHAYAAKHSMARSSYLNTHYGFPFPFLRDDFLSQAFSLSKKDKQDAKISKNLINKLVPSFSDVPFISGNQKGFRNHYLNVLKEGITFLMSKFVDTSRRNEDIFWNAPIVSDRLGGASSEITGILERFIKKNISRQRQKGAIKIKCALRMYLFLRHVEKNLGVEFICK